MATPISSSLPSRPASTGARAAIGWSARADAVLGSSTVRIRKTVAHGGRRESMKIGTRKNHAAPPGARNRRSQFGIYRSAAAGELRQLHKEPGRPPRRVGAQADLLFLCLLSGGLGRDWDGGGKPVMTRTQSLLTGVWLGVLLLGLAGCGAMQSPPDNPTGAGGLMPNVEDKDAGLVAVAPGFNISRYKVIVVEPFPVTDPTSKDEGDRQFAAKMAGFLQLELVRRLKSSGLFPTVVNGSQTQYKPGAQPALRLQGAITRLGRGSQVARYFAGLYGAGRARAQADMRFVEASSGRVGMVTADRRVASIGWVGGSGEGDPHGGLRDTAPDLGKVPGRASEGGGPREVTARPHTPP